MATRGRKEKLGKSGWRVLVGSVALGGAALGLAGSAVAGASSSTDTAPSGDPSGTVVIECASGVVTHAEGQTSSLVVAKVAGDRVPDLPEGCTVKAG